MKSTILQKVKTSAFILIITYLLMTVVRYLLAIATHPYPTVLIDEILYYSIARSIANGEGILFMGQPADYTSILYPLIIAPIYSFFQEGADYFKIIQFWNICLMNLSIFPMYALSKAISGDKKTSLLVSVITLMLPDMILGGMIMNESILYPMFFALLYFSYQYAKLGRLRDVLFAGLLGGLMFFTKPGQVVPAAVILSMLLWSGIQKRDWKHAGRVCVGIACLLLTIAASYGLVYFGFHHHVDIFGVYHMQLSSNEGLQLGAFLMGVTLSPLYLYIIGCGVCCMVPLMKLKRYNEQQKTILIAVMISLLITMLGTAWIINRVEHTDPSIHTRYIAMYIPVLLLYSLVDIAEAKQGKKMKTQQQKLPLSGWILTIYVIACAIVFGCKAGVNSNGHIISNLGLSFLRDTVLPPRLAWMVTFLIAGAALALAVFLPRLKCNAIKNLCFGSLIAFSILNGCVAYASIEAMVYPNLLTDTARVEELVGGQDYLYVYGTNKRFYNARLDVNSPKSISMVYVNDLFNKTNQTDGVYQPFVPDIQRGTKPDRYTPDTQLMVLDTLAYHHVKFAEGVQLLTPGEHELYVVSIPKDTQWVDCFLAGTVGVELAQGTSCVIKIFNKQMAASSVDVSIEMELEKASAVRVAFADQIYSFDLPAGRDTYKISLDRPCDLLNIIPVDSNARIYDYKIER